MTNTGSLPNAPRKSPVDLLESFFETMRTSNPFDVARVDRLTTADVDVKAIHEAEFKEITALAQKAQERNRGFGALLLGEAGAGKSHLLLRLKRWADQDNHATFVYLHNIQASPELLPRYTLKCVVNVLTQGRLANYHDTNFFRLLYAAMREALRLDGFPTDSEGVSSPTPDQLKSAYHKLVDRLGEADLSSGVLFDRTVYDVLLSFFISAYRRDDGLAELAVRWLSGEFLDGEEARRLGLRFPGNAEEPIALPDDELIKQVLVALTQIALSRKQPFLICFDQVENLQEDQITALSQFLQALLDSAGNLLVITSGVRQKMLEMEKEGLILEAAWSRMGHGQSEIAVDRINKQQGRQILEARLERFLEPFLALPAVKDPFRQDSLFPLGTAWLDDRLRDLIDFRPRDIINWASRCWKEQQERLTTIGVSEWLKSWQPPRPGGVVLPPGNLESLIDAKVDQKLKEHVDQRRQEPETLPPSGNNMAGLTYMLLQQCMNTQNFYSIAGVQKVKPPKVGKQPTYDLIIGQGLEKNDPSESGVVFITTSSAISTAAFLRRIQKDPKPPLLRLVVTDERQPLKLGAAGNAHLQELRQLGEARFRYLELTFDQYAHLDALQATIGLARSGDLEVEFPYGQIRPVSEPEVIASHHRRNRYQAHPLLGKLLTKKEADPSEQETTHKGEEEKKPPISDKEIREFIMAQLALSMGSSTDELAVRLVHHLEVTKGPPMDGADCKAKLEVIARKMHDDTLLMATPGENGLYLLLRTR